MLFIFTLTIFLSATLLFLVQPLFAKMVLPLLGGAPGVWNTAMLFFQACLLGGYAYAHFAPRLLGLRRHALLQALLLALPCLLLPMAIPAGTTPPQQTDPTLWLLGFMCLSVGAPFFALSTTSPTIQLWLASSGHKRAANPYFLYIASNVGSLLALLAYPLVIEPCLSLRTQQLLWAGGYLVLVLCMLVSAFHLRRDFVPPRHDARDQAPAARTRLFWILAAFVPSSLLLGVTTYISSEVAAVPLFWILPMGLYLLTFILAFSSHRWPGDAPLGRLLVLLGIPLMLVIGLGQRIQPIAPLLLLNLAVFFVAALLCHRRLSDSRPQGGHLTEFYLWISVGGALGGVFNALLAPLLFSTHLEYPLSLLLAGLLALKTDTSPARRSLLLAPLLTALAALPALLLAAKLHPPSAPGTSLLAMLLPALVCYFYSRRSLPYALSLSTLYLTAQFADNSPGSRLFQERSFFGISKVAEDTERHLRFLFHGLTIHGIQSTDPLSRLQALSYYHDRSPAGRILTKLSEQPAAKVGVIGLGAGSLAAYASAGQSWTFFEIDPVVARLASDRRFFSFLSDAKAPVRLVLGDARLTLAREPDHQLDVLVVDAYSSDAIPVHLITQEAFLLYQAKLKPGGILLCHISNNHIELEPLLGGIASNLGLQAFTNVDESSDDLGRSASTWMLLAANQANLQMISDDRNWKQAQACAPQDVWRDDFSSILNALRWK